MALIGLGTLALGSLAYQAGKQNVATRHARNRNEENQNNYNPPIQAQANPPVLPEYYPDSPGKLRNELQMLEQAFSHSGGFEDPESYVPFFEEMIQRGQNLFPNDHIDNIDDLHKVLGI